VLVGVLDRCSGQLKEQEQETASMLRQSSSKKDAHVVWDEENLKTNEEIQKQYSTVKIAEPKTPYRPPLVDAEMDEEMRPLELDDEESKRHNSISIKVEWPAMYLRIQARAEPCTASQPDLGSSSTAAATSLVFLDLACCCCYNKTVSVFQKQLTIILPAVHSVSCGSCRAGTDSSNDSFRLCDAQWWCRLHATRPIAPQAADCQLS
jgi:hypothetical protein